MALDVAGVILDVAGVILDVASNFCRRLNDREGFHSIIGSKRPPVSVLLMFKIDPEKAINFFLCYFTSKATQ